MQTQYMFYKKNTKVINKPINILKTHNSMYDQFWMKPHLAPANASAERNNAYAYFQSIFNGFINRSLWSAHSCWASENRFVSSILFRMNKIPIGRKKKQVSLQKKISSTDETK